MIATEPLPDAFWDEIGIAHGQTFTDYRHLLIYGQRTADNRFAFGGRGARYHWGSAIRPGYDRAAAGVRAPASARCASCSRRSGMRRSPTAGAARSACRATGTRASSSTRRPGSASAGGYVGDGLSTTNLAGRTLADLLTGADTELTRPPVGRAPLPELGARAAAVRGRQRRDARR